MLPRMLWLLLALLPAARALALGDLLFERIGDADSIPDNNVTALAQDHAGFLWIGTPNGLIRFDGYRYTRYLRDPQDPHSLGGVFIRALLVAADGRLWIGTDADGVSVLDPASGRFLNLRHDPQDPGSLAHDQVRALAQSADGSIWLGTRAGLQRWEASAGRFQGQPALGGGGDQRVYALAADAAGQLWIGAWSGVHVRRADGRVEQVPGALAGRLIMSLLPLADGQVAVGTAEIGSHLVDPVSLQSRTIPAALEQMPTATEALALAMVQPRADELWLGAFGGIAVLDPRDGRLLRRIRPDPAVRTSLAHAQVRCFLLDRAGQVWIGGYSGGLQRHDPRSDAIRVLHASPGRAGALSSPSISSILELPEGLLWLGTRENGIDLLDPVRGVIGGHRARPDLPGALGNGMVISLARTVDGSIYAGTLAGMYRHDPLSGRFTPIGRADGLSGTTVRTLLADPGGDLWIGSNTGLARWRPAQRRIEEIPSSAGGLLAADVNALALEPGGRLWVGSAGGLYRLDAGASALAPVHAADAGEAIDPAHESVVGLLLDRAGGLWVDTSEGLLRMRELAGGRARFDAISLRHGIGGQPFGANLLEDAQGRIWTQKYVYDPAADEVYELTRADGLDIGTAWFRSHARLRDGRLLFGGSEGLAIVEPARFERWRHRPPLAIAELRVDGQPLLPGAWRTGLTLPAGARGFSVEFAALDYSAPRRNRYAYRLEGFDPDWIATDASRRVAAYSNLWPGAYRLLVRGSNRNGDFSEPPLALAVTVQPRYWQTSWFALLLLASAGAIGWLAWQRHLRRVRRHERELEAMVGARTQELSEAKEAAEDMLARLRDTQQQLVVTAKMASLGQLVAGVAHEINTPLGIALTAASVQGEELRELRRKVDAQALRGADVQAYLGTVEQAARLVDEHLQRAVHLVRSFKQVSVDRSTDERRRFVLDEYLRDLVESLESVWRRRPIRMQLACAPGLVLDSYPGTLGQVITTLAQNALLHAFDEDARGNLAISARALDADAVELEFADDGRGIAPADLPRIFEPFFTTRRADGCVGLGLHIVFNQVHARLGGNIAVDSAPGRGTRFLLRFPRVAP